MSDRGDWDHWDFGDSDGDDGWDEIADDDEPVPVDDGRWGAAGVDEGPDAAVDDDGRDGPPRGALLAALGVMLVLAVAIAAIVLQGDDDGDDTRGDSAAEVETDDEPSSTSSTRRSTTTTTVAVTAPDGDDDAADDESDGDGDAGDEDGSTSTTARGGGGTATTRGTTTSSTIPDDGETPGCVDNRRSLPAPTPVPGGQPNDPLTMSLCTSDTTPAVGQRVTFYLRADDPDAPIVNGPCGWRIYTDSTQHASCYAGLPRTGPVEQVPGRVVVERTVVFDTPGARSIVGVAESSQGTTEVGPYADSAYLVLPITVRG